MAHAHHRSKAPVLPASTRLSLGETDLEPQPSWGALGPPRTQTLVSKPPFSTERNKRPLKKCWSQGWASREREGLEYSVPGSDGAIRCQVPPAKLG